MLVLALLIGAAFFWLAYPANSPVSSIGIFFLLAAVYAFYKNPYAVYSLFLKLQSEPKLGIPIPRDPSEVPKPEETKQAKEHMRAAFAFLDDTETAKDNYSQLHILSNASMAIAKARALDPRASVTYGDPGKEFSMTIDHASGHVLYMESLLYQKQADASGKNLINNLGINKHAVKINRADEAKELKLALNAIDKALKYSDYSKYHLHRALLLNRIGNSKEYRIALDRAYQLDPNNVEVLKARSYL